MPKLDPDKRASIEGRLAVHQRIMDSFKDKQYLAQHCHFCNWASNGLSLDEAIAENRRHEEMDHATEVAEMQATYISMSELGDSFHDHECEMALCQCRCGCQSGPFCHTIMGPLCGNCMIAAGRGHDEHGKKEVKDGEG